MTFYMQIIFLIVLRELLIAFENPIISPNGVSDDELNRIFTFFSNYSIVKFHRETPLIEFNELIFESF